jgi:hypothetical protein
MSFGKMRSPRLWHVLGLYHQEQRTQFPSFPLRPQLRPSTATVPLHSVERGNGTGQRFKMRRDSRRGVTPSKRREQEVLKRFLSEHLGDSAKSYVTSAPPTSLATIPSRRNPQQRAHLRLCGRLARTDRYWGRCRRQLEQKSSCDVPRRAVRAGSRTAS